MAKVNKMKVNLDLLKKLVGELETSLQTADGIRDTGESHDEYVIELSKAGGLAVGVMQEASMLMLDIHSLVQIDAGAKQPNILDTILAPLKGGSN